MIKTIRHQDTGREIVAAKLLTGWLTISKGISDPDSYIKVNCIFDADFVAHIVAWQSNHGLTPDGIIGPATWTAMAKAAPTCSTSKNRTSSYTMALQILLDTNIVCDGIYGAKTKAAVMVFQQARGLNADGICGPKTWNALIVGKEETIPGTFKHPVDYKQGDSRWGKKMYSNHNDKSQTMASSGCGPTAMADIVATLIDPAVTPWTLAQLAMEWGDRTYNSGTAWTFFIPHIMEHYGFPQAVQTKNLDALKACLDAGGYAVCSMGPGYWTKGGHFICAWKYDATYIYCNDPASSSRKKQKITEFVKERKQYFCFYPKKKDRESEPEPQESEPAKIKRIIDISKWQGDINFDKLKNEVALVIARAGVGSDADPKFDEYAKAMNDRGIPFGVYCYSYAGTEEKARDEAQNFVRRAGKYKPRFYAMDAEEAKITSAAIRAFADEMRKQGVTRMGCYVAHHRYTQYGYANLRTLFDFDWIPRYGKNDGTIEGATEPDYPYDMWQYTSTGKIAGISGNVDMNVLSGSKPFEWFLGGE